ncbi:MAG: hypothetical protein QM564_12895 [Bergeyella sp.]
MLKKIFFLFLVIINVLGFSQTLGAGLDKKTLALGEVATFKVKIFDLEGKDVVSAPKNELLPFHFEEIKDSIIKTPEMYERIIQFQVFEEGKFTIPALDFKIDGTVQHTVPYEIEVVNTAQQGDEISDIMNNREVSLNARDYWDLYKWYLLGFMILLALIILLYQLVKYARQRKNSPVVMTNKTLKALDVLKKKKYIEDEDFRSFYVELVDITRDFLTKQYQIPADVLLTDDLVDLMKNHNTISPENEKTVEDVLLRGDLVKFAKTFPPQEVMQKDWQEIRDFVKRSSKDLELEKLIRKDV